MIKRILISLVCYLFLFVYLSSQDFILATSQNNEVAKKVFSEFKYLPQKISSMDEEQSVECLKASYKDFIMIQGYHEFFPVYRADFFKTLDILFDCKYLKVKQTAVDFLKLLELKQVAYEGDLQIFFKKQFKKSKDIEERKIFLSYIQLDLYNKDIELLLLINDLLNEDSVVNDQLKTINKKERSYYFSNQNNKLIEDAIGAIISTPPVNQQPVDLSLDQNNFVEERLKKEMILLQENLTYYMGETKTIKEDNQHVVYDGEVRKVIPRGDIFIKKIMYMLDDNDERQLDLIFLSLKNVLGYSLLAPYAKTIIGDYFISYKLRPFVGELYVNKIKNGILELMNLKNSEITLHAVCLFLTYKKLINEKNLSVDFSDLEKNIIQKLEKTMEVTSQSSSKKGDRFIF